MRHAPCGHPIAPSDWRRQPLTDAPDEKIAEMIPYCPACNRDVPVEELAEDEPDAGQQVIRQ